MSGAPEQILHATTVSLGERAVLLLGRSGSGKSETALWLMAFGARLIADDRTRVTRREGQIIASCPETIRGRIEARRVGILVAEPAPPCPVALAVDLELQESDRLPPMRQTHILDVPIALVHGRDCPHLAPAILQYLKAGRAD